MGTDCSLLIRLKASYSLENITVILQKGELLKGFIYHNHIPGESYRNAPILNAKEAALKVINAFEKNLEDGPAVYCVLENDTSAHLWFYKGSDGYLEFYIGSFSCPQKKNGDFDFAYYIKIFLDVCDDFVIVEVKTEMF